VAIIQGGGYATHAVIPVAAAIPLPAGFDHALGRCSACPRCYSLHPA
jgi:hypothetical protein